LWLATGLVGSAIVRRLAVEKCEVLTADRNTLDLTDQRATENWLESARPDAIFLAAGLVGGIHANNTYPASRMIMSWRPVRLIP
jgi:GDP-L-fucose synthase